MTEMTMAASAGVGYYAPQHFNPSKNHEIIGYSQPGRQIRGVVPHTSESSPTWDVDDLALYMLMAPAQGNRVSWHVSVGDGGIRWMLPDTWVAGHSGLSYNGFTLGVEVCYGHDRWGSDPELESRMVRDLGTVCGIWARRYNLPIRLDGHKSTPIFPGFVRHSQLSSARHDPGLTFPTADFIRAAGSALALRAQAIGDYNIDVGIIQGELGSFYQGEIDDDFGPLTHAAVIAKEKALGLDQTGVWWPGRRQPPPTPVPSDPEIIEVVLKRNQQALISYED